MDGAGRCGAHRAGLRCPPRWTRLARGDPGLDAGQPGDVERTVRGIPRRRPAPCVVYRHRARRHVGRPQLRLVRIPARPRAQRRAPGIRRHSRQDGPRATRGHRLRWRRPGPVPPGGDVVSGGRVVMLSRRIVPCLDVRDGRVVKGVRFRDHVDMGDVVAFAKRYRDAGADELVFYDIAASPEGRSVSRTWVERVARELDIPFCVAGGIRDVETARALLAAGADKVSINTPALERPALIAELASEFGTQCVVVGVDSLREEDGAWRVRSHTGSAHAMQSPGRRTLDWIEEAQALGAGEIVLNCMDGDGVRAGYDIAQLRAARAVCGEIGRA